MSGSILGLELVKEVYKETSILAEHAQVLAMHGKAVDMRVVDISNTLKEFENIFQVLNEMKTKFEDRISILGKSILEINCVSTSVTVFKSSIVSLYRHDLVQNHTERQLTSKLISL